MSLSVEYDEANKRIVIVLPTDAMVSAVEQAPFIHSVSETPEGASLKVTDPAAFAKGVVAALEQPTDESGGTLLHDMFDDAFEDAIENGTPGFSWPAAGIP